MNSKADVVTSIFNNQGDGTVSSQYLRTVMQLLDPGVFTDPFVDRLLEEFHKATGCSDASGSIDVSAFNQWIISANDSLSLNATQVHTKLLQVLESVVSICCYRCVQGKEAEWKQVVDDITSDVQTGGVQGLLQCHHAMIGDRTFVCVGLFDSTKALENYKVTACKRYLEQMQPFLDGSAVFDDVGMALTAKSFGDPAAAMQQICCMCSYQCAEGKEEEWEAVVADITAMVKTGGIEGMTTFISVMPDQRTFSCVGLFESQEAVDLYASMMSSQFISKMKPLLCGDAIYDIVTPLQNYDPAYGAFAGA